MLSVKWHAFEDSILKHKNAKQLTATKREADRCLAKMLDRHRV